MVWRGVHKASNGFALGMVSPRPSVMSTSSPGSFSHSKQWIKVASARPITRMARPSPGHLRRPA
ncbi:hypothetical protein GW17_00061628, partial [Ensete ventricosum]